MEVTKWLKPSISVSCTGDSASVQAATRVNAEQASKRTMRGPTRPSCRGRLIWLGDRAKTTPIRRAGAVAAACTQGKRAQHGKPLGVAGDGQPDAREGQAGRLGVAERPVIPTKLGNARGGKRGGKGPQFKTNARRGEGPGDWATYQLRKAFRNCRRRYTRKRRLKPATASMPVRQDFPRRYSVPCLRFVPLQQGRAGRGRPRLCGCRSIWRRAVAWRTGACAQGRELPAGPDPARVHTEGQRQTQAAGQLHLAGSGLHDSSDAGAGADLRSRSSTRTVCVPPWAQRPASGGGGGSAYVPGRPDIVDADLADYFGSIPHADLLKSLARRVVDRRVLHLIKM